MTQNCEEQSFKEQAKQSSFYLHIKFYVSNKIVTAENNGLFYDADNLL